MKKKILSILLAICLVFGSVPAMTVQSDAIIGSILKAGFTVCKSVINGTIKTVKNIDYYDGNVGKAVLGQFKNIGADLTGLDIGEDYGEGGSGSGSGSSGESGTQQPTQVVVNVSLDEVRDQMKLINNKLDETNNAIYQLESTVTSGIKDLSVQLDQLNDKLNKLGNTVTETAQLNRDYTYLTEFFSFYNQYYEGISHYDRQLAYALNGNRSDKYIKNVFDQFYHLQNVEYSGSLSSSVDKLGKYIRGEYMGIESGSVIDVLSRYYIQVYKLTNTGCSDEDARKAAAAALEETIGYVYYAYSMGVYYEEAIMMYQSAYMETNEDEEYLTDFGSYISVEQLGTQYSALCDDTLLTASGILRSIYQNFPNGTFKVPYFIGKDENGNLTGGFTRTVSASEFTVYRMSSWSDRKSRITSHVFYLPDAATGISGYFSDEFKDTFMGLTSYELAEGTDEYLLKQFDGNRFETGTRENKTATVNICVLNKIVSTVNIYVKPIGAVDYNQMIGAGTEDFPYVIETVDDFKTMFKNNSAHYVLANDIDLGSTNIGTNSFYGVLDGNGHSVSYNLNITSSLNSGNVFYGLFYELGGIVRNLTIKNSSLVANYSNNEAKTPKLTIGLLASKLVNGGAIYRCSVENSNLEILGTRANNNPYPDVYMGALVGEVTNGTVQSCRNIDTTVKDKNSVSTTNDVGGIVGILVNGTVSDNYYQVENEETSIEGYRVGGIVGEVSGGATLNNCMIMLRYLPFKNYKIAGAIAGKVNASSSPKITGTFVFGDKTVGGVSGGIIMFEDPSMIENANIAEFGESSDAVKNNKNIFSAQIKYAKSKYRTIDTSFLTGFESNLDARLESTDTLKLKWDLKSSSIKTSYSEGEGFSAAGWTPYLANGNGSKDSHLYYYSLNTEGFKYDEALDSGNKCSATFSTGFASRKYDLKVNKSHIYVEVTSPATCTEAGSSYLVCIDCGEKQNSKTIPAIGHNEVKDAAVSPTCVGSGLTEGSHCSRCGKVMTAQTVIPSTGEHGHTIVKGYDATCSKDGLTDKDYCEGCGLVHQEATVIKSTGHKMKEYTVLEATCTSGGIVQEKCETCGEYGDFKTVKAVGHSYTKTVTAPTCTGFGYTTYSCNNCGHEYVSSYTAPLGHSFDGEAASCTHSSSCTVCGAVGTDHNSQKHESEAQWTRTEKYHTYSYPCCGHVEINREAHDWKDGVCLTCGYTCSHKGGIATCTHAAECTLCGEEYGDLNPNNHKSETVWSMDDDTHEQKWNCCGVIVAEKEAHDYNWGTCTVCGYVHANPIWFTIWTAVKAAFSSVSSFFGRLF